MYQEQNTDLDTNIKTHHSDLLTNDRKTYYEQNATSSLKTWYRFFWYIYCSRERRNRHYYVNFMGKPR